MDVNTTELYLTICCAPFGTQILIDAEGEIHTAESGLSLRGFPEDWLYFGKAEGDFDRSDWGIDWNDDRGGFVVEKMDGVFDTQENALRAAVEYFGLDANTHDELNDKVSKLLGESQKEIDEEKIRDMIYQEKYRG